MSTRMFNRVSLVLTLLNIAVIFLVVVAVLAVVYGITASRLRQAEEDDVVLRASSAAQTLAASEFEGEHIEGDLDPGELNAWIFDSRGRVIESPPSVVTGLPLREHLSDAFDGTSSLSRVDSGDSVFIVATSPVFHERRVVGAVQAFGQDESVQALQALLLGLIAAGVGGLAVAAVAGYSLSRFAMRPVRAAFDRQRAFIADASHELRTPIAVIQADADAVSRIARGLPVEDAQLLEDLQQEAAFAGRTVARLLDLARLDARDSSVATEAVDVSSLAAEVVSAMRPLADAAGIALQCEECDSAITGRADRDRLRLGLMAVIDNAIKYTPQGGAIVVCVELSGHRVSISVQDNGEGIPPDLQAKVFERFYRVDKSRSRATGGAGLGLPLVKESVIAMGGDASLTSVPGVGTTVSITLRAA